MAPSNPTVLEPLVVTERLEIRAWELGDAAALHAAIEASTAHLLPWMEWAATLTTLDDRRRMIEEWESARRSGGDMVAGMWRGTELVGACGLHHRSRPGVLDIGYWVLVDHVGNGYATEATAGLTSAAMELSTTRAVRICHDGANLRSRAIPHRLQYVLTGVQTHPVEAPGEAGWRCEWTMTPGRWREAGGRRTSRDPRGST